MHLVRWCSLGGMHLVKVQEHCRGMDKCRGEEEGGDKWMHRGEV